MIGQTISHYPALCRCTAFRKAERDPEQRDKILEKLGEGGMGEVYLAEDTKFHPVESRRKKEMIS